jgi:hypothetical protein
MPSKTAAEVVAASASARIDPRMEAQCTATVRAAPTLGAQTFSPVQSSVESVFECAPACAWSLLMQ